MKMDIDIDIDKDHMIERLLNGSLSIEELPDSVFEREGVGRRYMEPLLYYIIMGGDVGFLYEYIDRNGNPDLKSLAGKPMIHIAVETMNPDMIHPFLDEQRLRATDSDGNTIFHIVARSVNTDMFDAIFNADQEQEFEFDASLFFIPNHAGITAFELLIMRQNVSLVRRFIEHYRKLPMNEKQRLFTSAMLTDNIEIIDLIHGASIFIDGHGHRNQHLHSHSDIMSYRDMLSYGISHNLGNVVSYAHQKSLIQVDSNSSLGLGLSPISSARYIRDESIKNYSESALSRIARQEIGERHRALKNPSRVMLEVLHRIYGTSDTDFWITMFTRVVSLDNAKSVEFFLSSGLLDVIKQASSIFNQRIKNSINESTGNVRSLLAGAGLITRDRQQAARHSQANDVGAGAGVIIVKQDPWIQTTLYRRAKHRAFAYQAEAEDYAKFE